MKKNLFYCLCAITLMSCVENSAEYKQLKNENETLKADKVKTMEEFNEMLSILDDIQTDIQSIQETENYVSIEKTGEFSETKREQLKNNINLIAETLKNNKEQLAAIKEQFKNSKIQSSALQKTIDRISAELNHKAEMIASLQEELAKKDIHIRELDNIVTSLNKNVEHLSQTTTVQADELKEQDKKLHTAYYCFGTKKELKEQNILTGGGLFSKTKAMERNFNEDYFIAIDIRTTREIPLYANKAKIRSNHSEASYQFVKDSNGNLSLHITDIDLFWRLGKYLVIEVG
ncbi:MAG: hypothetical protein LBH90_00730 [Tannerella sp.]|nr:hypothetical protein [Tannerella sp.]